MWYVLGSGSVGCLLASRLSRAGHSCTVIARAVSINNTLNINLINTFDQSNGQTSVHVPIQPSHANNNTSIIEKVLISTKAFDAPTAIQSIQHRLATNAVLIVLCNGMGVIEAIEKINNNNTRWKLFVGVNSHGCFRMPSDVALQTNVVHSGLGNIHIGSLKPENQLEAKEIAEELQSGGHNLNISYDDEILRAMILKLCANACINAFTAIFDIRNGELLNQSVWKNHLMKSVVSEIHELAISFDQTSGSACRLNLSKQELEEYSLKVLVQAQNNFSSMCMDMKNSRPTEIDFINGYIASMSKERGIEAPCNDFLTKMVQLKTSIFRERNKMLQ